MGTPADSLARIIAHVESAGHLYALRFEPKVYAEELQAPSRKELDVISLANMCTTETAEVIYSASWGAYQVMGRELYAQGWAGPIAEYLADSVAQKLSFLRFLDVKQLPQSWEAMRVDQGALEHFALRYNGSTAYAQRMLEAAKVLGL